MIFSSSALLDHNTRTGFVHNVNYLKIYSLILAVDTALQVPLITKLPSFLEERIFTEITEKNIDDVTQIIIKTNSDLRLINLKDENKALKTLVRVLQDMDNSKKIDNLDILRFPSLEDFLAKIKFAPSKDKALIMKKLIKNLQFEQEPLDLLCDWFRKSSDPLGCCSSPLTSREPLALLKRLNLLDFPSSHTQLSPSLLVLPLRFPSPSQIFLVKPSPDHDFTFQIRQIAGLTYFFARSVNGKKVKYWNLLNKTEIEMYYEKNEIHVTLYDTD